MKTINRFIFSMVILIMASCQMENTWECDGNCNNGKGTKEWKDGGIERGKWKDGELIGVGYQLFGSTSNFAGDSYKGEFLHGYNGFGIYIDVSEDATYKGFWKNGKADGKGKLSYGKNSSHPNRYYDGEWKNGLRHGYGVKFWGEAGDYTDNKYEGEWKNDKMDGFGKYYWPNKGTYIGMWKNDEQDGEGMYIFSNGDTLKSRWVNGYCRELAVMLNGENSSSFETVIGEITFLSKEHTGKLINELTRELINSGNSSEKIDFNLLRELLDTALLYQKKAIPKLENVKEYDEKIPYKQDFLSYQHALMDMLNECDIWINLNLNDKDPEAIQQSFDKLYARLKIVKEREVKFTETKEKFIDKYDK